MSTRTRFGLGLLLMIGVAIGLFRIRPTYETLHLGKTLDETFHVTWITQDSREKNETLRDGIDSVVERVDSLAVSTSEPADSLLSALYSQVLHEAGLIDSLTAQSQSDASLSLRWKSLLPGFAVDQIAGVLRDAGVANYLVEVGDVAKANGTRLGEVPWKAGLRNASFAVHEVSKEDSALEANQTRIRTIEVREKYAMAAVGLAEAFTTLSTEEALAISNREGWAVRIGVRASEDVVWTESESW